MVEIREYTHSDAAKMAELLVEFQGYIVHLDDLKRQRLAENYGEKYLKLVLQKIRNQNGKLYIAQEDGEIVGFVVGIIHTHSDEDLLELHPNKEGKILKLYVGAMSRGKGIGKKLFKKMESFFSEQSCDYISVTTFEKNEPALKFYEKHGYTTRAIYFIKQTTRS